MALNNTTKYRLSNKYDKSTNSFDKSQFEFENKGNYGKGRISWSIANKKGDKTTFENSTIGFVCFGENIALFENNLDGRFLIDGTISQKINAKAVDGQPKSY